MSMTQQLHRCCGIILAHSFEKKAEPISNKGMTKTEIKYHGYTDEFVAQYNKNHAETHEQWTTRVQGFLEQHIKETKNEKSYTLVALNKDEDKYLSEAVLKAGFEILVPMMKNPTGTEIILYVHYHIQKPWEEKKVVRKSIFKKAS